ncbi:single-strand binding protein [Bifidobacterium saguini DSM 23967]|uniref:Single-stranded DNA-binding protein n=1 Tax=Bifidobacterium saguini DSM 23967 TaxID=1437607 RepID=A0A087D6Y5_9BIFI|nr:single-stranded DNA-binding protein [Bifidobacterium saguini]KFI91285.1 single-strand binding protein [Bifidobacterium saguini DSM 23967]
MATINLIHMTVTGNAGQIEYRTNREGTTFASFSIAQNARVQNQQTGQWEDGATTWIRCTAAGPLAEHMRASGFTKGTRLVVTGTYQQRDYQDQNGAKRTTYELHAEDVAASVRYATATVTKTQTAQGFTGRSQIQTAMPAGNAWSQPAPQPQQTTQPTYTDGFAPANPQQPTI